MVGAKNIIIVSILLRVLIIPFLYHTDIKTQYYHAQFFSQGVVNIYHHIYSNANTLGNTVPFVYTPPSYFLLGSYYPLAKLIAPNDLTNWLNNWGLNQNQYANLPWFILILKLPYLFIDILFGIYLYKKYGKTIAKYWLLNPFVIYSLYFHSNFDIIPSILAFVSLEMLSNSKYTKISGFIFSSAIAIKLFPLLFLPLILKTNKKKIITFTISFVLTSFIYLTIFNLVTPNWLSSVTSSGLLQKVFEFKILNVSLFPILYIFLALWFFINKNSNNNFFVSIIGLIFLSIVTFHGQWIIWFLPYFIFSFSKLKKQYKLLSLVILSTQVLKILLYNDTYMTWGHLLPLDPNFLVQSTPYFLLSTKNLITPKEITYYLQIFQLFTVIFIFLKHAKKNNFN